MAIRLSGLVSNMDTDSIIKELMNAQNLKKTKVENKITTTEWKQEKWKALNAKIYALYTGSINKMRFQSAFATNKVTSSDETKVSVTASSSAVAGSHTIEVSKLASAQYVTSSPLASTVTGATKLSVLDPTLTASGETKINFTTAEKSFSLTITANTTLADFVSAANSAGIKASYDTTQKRIFLSSAESGAQSAYSITTSSATAAEITAKNSIRSLVGYSDLGSAGQSVVDNAIDQFNIITEKLKTATGDTKTKLEADLETAKSTIYTYTQNKVTNDLKAAYSNTSTTITAEQATQYGVRTLDVVVTDAKKAYNDSLSGKPYNAVDEQKAVDLAIAAEASKYATAVKAEFVASAPATNPYTTATQNVNNALTTKFPVAIAADDAVLNGTNKLTKLGLSTVKAITDAATGVVTYETSEAAKITLVGASDSKIIYNGATLTGTTNTITANGITFDAHAQTTAPVTLTVAKDTQGTYDTIKKFVKEYNALLTEMNSLYYAESTRGYDPLTDEEKEAMSEGQIDKWETKIKDSLLRRDNKLGSLLNTMKTSMMGSADYEGKSYALSTFGIGTSLYTEKGLLHIDGDPDDITTAMNTDKLKVALENDPEAVMTTITTIMGNLYTEMSDKMKTSSLNSALTFYNDKELSSNLKTYKSDLKTLESRLKKVEDKYYKQFSAMETAMSKLNSQSSSLASLMGTN